MSDIVAAVEGWLQSLPVAASALVLVAGSLAAAWLVTVVGFRVTRRVVRSTETEYDDVLFAELRVPVATTVAAAGFYLAGAWLELAPTSGFYLRAGTLTVVVVVWARGLARLGDRAIEAVDEDSEFVGFAPIFENLWTFAILVASAFALLSLWRIDVTPLLASAGIAGIAIGFAARDTIANFFGSISLYLDDTYAVGDYVVLDSGEAGTVVDVTIRSTRLLTRDNVVITVPNSVLNSARIVNESAPVPHRRITVPVGVAYGSDLETVENTLLECAAGEDLVAANPEPRARFRRFGDSALEYELLCWVPDPTRAARATHRLNRAIYGAFRDAGVEIQFPQREVTVRGDVTAAGHAGDGQVEAAQVEADGPGT